MAKFIEEMERRRLRWRVPTDWQEKDLVHIIEKVVDQHKDNLLMLKSALCNGSLRVERL